MKKHRANPTVKGWRGVGDGILATDYGPLYYRTKNGKQAMRFNVTTESRNRLGLRERCQKYADELWMPEHLYDEQAADFVLDGFNRMVAGELELLVVKRVE